MCATGCGADPNTISATAFDVYYNPNIHSSQSPIGDPFYLIVATPVYTGSTNSPTVGGTATMYSPYPGGTTSTVTVGGAVPSPGGEMTSGDLYGNIGLGPFANNSFQFNNMVACDVGTTGGSGCPNASLGGSGAPLFGDTITGYDVFTFLIGTNNFAPNDLLDFTGNLPIGSYVAAIGVDYSVGPNGEAWAVPFTESGLVTTTTTPEPGSLPLLGVGLLALGVLASRRVLTA